MSRDGWTRYSGSGTPHYDVVMAGFKYNMMDLQAAIGLRQLARIDELFARRVEIWRRYDEALADLPVVRPAPPPPEERHARHLYTILIDPARCGRTRDDVQQALQHGGIGTSVHFKALHLQPFYAERYGFSRGMFPAAEAISETTLSLPLSAALTDADADAVIAAIRGVFAA